ncbi:MAG: 2-C-methyl-D-erythritol 4-phosphate cytidylyltransferase [Planctomycetota bacterium]
MIGLVLTAAGASTRFGGETPKVLADLGGRPVIAHALAAFRAVIPDVAVVVTAPAGLEARFAEALSGVHVVTGGATRQASVLAGLRALPHEADPILVHDAARPLLGADVIRRVLEGIATAGAALPVLPVTDTVHRLAHAPTAVTAVPLAAALPRDELVRAQTPQGARRALLVAALEAAARDGRDYTDEAALLLAAGHVVLAVAGDARLAKITTREDLDDARRRHAAG